MPKRTDIHKILVIGSGIISGDESGRFAQLQNALHQEAADAAAKTPEAVLRHHGHRRNDAAFVILRGDGAGGDHFAVQLQLVHLRQTRVQPPPPPPPPSAV